VRLHLWTEYSFPWNVGLHLQQLTPATADRAAADVAAGPWEPVEYLTS
jgi:hypothetical protein